MKTWKISKDCELRTILESERMRTDINLIICNAKPIRLQLGDHHVHPCARTRSNTARLSRSCHRHAVLPSVPSGKRFENAGWLAWIYGTVHDYIVNYDNI